MAHARGVAVEAELGELPCGSAGGDRPSRGGNSTDPAAAADFVATTGVDLLAVSAGDIHVRTSGEGELDLALLGAFAASAGTACPSRRHRYCPESLRAAIGLGVAKVNFGTYLKQRYLKAIRAALDRDCVDPHRLLGIGGPEDVMVAGRRAVRDAVLERIDLLGCSGRAVRGTP